MVGGKMVPHLGHEEIFGETAIFEHALDGERGSSKELLLCHIDERQLHTLNAEETRALRPQPYPACRCSGCVHLTHWTRHLEGPGGQRCCGRPPARPSARRLSRWEGGGNDVADAPIGTMLLGNGILVGVGLSPGMSLEQKLAAC